jgi:hypothetical protein
MAFEKFQKKKKVLGFEELYDREPVLRIAAEMALHTFRNPDVFSLYVIQARKNNKNRAKPPTTQETDNVRLWLDSGTVQTFGVIATSVFLSSRCYYYFIIFLYCLYCFCDCVSMRSAEAMKDPDLYGDVTKLKQGGVFCVINQSIATGKDATEANYAKVMLSYSTTLHQKAFQINWLSLTGTDPLQSFDKNSGEWKGENGVWIETALFGGPIYSIAGPGDVSRMLLSHLLS